MKHVTQHIEALIFATDHPTTETEILESLKQTYEWELSKEELEEQLQQIKEKYESEDFAFYLTKSGGGYQYMTKTEYFPVIAAHLKLKAKKKLSSAALETLSIIAYKQPIIKSEIEQIRGVNCDYTVSKLLEKELITMVGRAEGPGRPLLYGTSTNFMDYFGINSPNELPQLKEVEGKNDQTIGEEEKTSIDEEALLTGAGREASEEVVPTEKGREANKEGGAEPEGTGTDAAE